MYKETLKEIFLKNGKILPSRTTEAYINNHNLKKILDEYFDDSFSIIEKVYCIVHDIEERPKCSCGKILKFKYRYPKFCSKKCANNDPEVLKKNKEGVSKSLKKAYDDRGDLIKKKRNETLLKNYGEEVNSPFAISAIKEKAKKAIFEKYGVDNIFRLKEFRGDNLWVKNDSIQQWKERGFRVEYIEDKLLNVYDVCELHNPVKIDIITFYNRANRERKGIICPICCPVSSYSSLEIIFKNFLKKYNIQFKQNTKKIIYPQEIDFFLPEHNIGIELNGVYWHSELFKPAFYHINKTNKCLEKGIKLIHIWEDDIDNKWDIIESLLLNKLNMSLHKIYARKCFVKEIDSNTYRTFLNETHLQGKINSSIKLGLFYNENLVSVMGFGKLRKSMGSKSIENEYELHRFSSLLNTVVIGGASKMLSYFEKKNNPSSIITYAKIDYSNGNLYEKLGFKLIKKTHPGYYWVINEKRKHRFSFRKDVLLKNHPNVDPNKSEIEIMHAMGYVRAFDSGNLKYVKKFNVF